MFLLVVFKEYQQKHQQIPMIMHDERENKTSLLKYEVCALLMVSSIQNNSVRIKQVGYGSITVNNITGLVRKPLKWFC